MNDRSPTSVRFGVIAFLALAAGSAYLTRHCIAVANTTIQKELSLSDEQMGWVFGAFAAGYFVCQIPGGWLGNRIGTRGALASLSVLWSAFTVWSAAVFSILPLVASRVFFGFAQAGLVPITAKIINDWFSVHRRGIYSAIIGASMSIGGVAAMGLTAWLIEDLHWREIFRLYSLVGVVWSIGFFAYFRTKPEQHPWVNDAELRLIHDQPMPEVGNEPAGDSPNDFGEGVTSRSRGNEATAKSSGKDVVQWMLASETLWGINLQSFFRAAAYVLFVTWFPTILERRYEMSPSEAGFLATYPLAAVIVGTLSGGWLVDFLFRRTASKRISRSGVAFVALATSGLFVFASRMADSPGLFVALMSLAAMSSGFGNPAAWAATMDVAGRQTAIVVGAMNMAGTLGGLAMPVVLGIMIGEIKETGGDWNAVIYLFAATYAAGALCWLAVDPNDSLPAESSC
jgi:MFS family permease